jgi:cytoskeletal protein CcmA (bactofilin family)
VARRLPVVLLLVVLAGTAAAARLEGGSSFTLPREQTLLSDLYFGGSALRLDGPVEGSVIAGCQTATLSGPVAGNVFVAAQSVDITAPVRGDITAACQSLAVADSVGGALRAMAQTVTVSGRVGRDVLGAAGTLTIAETGEVVGDVVCGAGTVNIAGQVRGDVRAAGNEVVVSGIVDGDLVIEADEAIILTSEARVFGDLRYRADRELELGNPDAVFGTIEFEHRSPHRELEDIKPFRPSPRAFTAFLLPFAILSVLGALCAGFILIAIWKRALLSALDSALARFGRTVGFGAIGLFATPLVLAVGLALIVTIPASLIGGLLYIIFLYLGKVLAGMFLGRWLFRIFGGRTASIWLTAPVGIILAWALCAVPVIGWLLWLFGLMIGFGVIVELLGISRRP